MALVRRLVVACINKNTKRSYWSAFKLYTHFHWTYYGASPSTAITNAKISKFIAFCFTEGLQHSVRVSARCYVCKMSGRGNPSDCFKVKTLLLGCKRLSSSADKRRPITLDILKQLMQHLPYVFHNRYNINLFKSMFTLAFFALLRVGEMTVTTSAQHTLLKKNVTVHYHGKSAQSLSITIPHAKHSHTPSTFRCTNRKILHYVQLNI